MRRIALPLLLLLALPLSAQTAKFLKVDIVSENLSKQAKRGDGDGPKEVHVRMPIALANGLLDMAKDGEIKVHGKSRKGLKPEQLQKLLADAKSGDLLLEITTDKGDHIRVTIE
jgi:hypothetical protein